jgi:hypothetical protein
MRGKRGDQEGCDYEEMVGNIGFIFLDNIINSRPGGCVGRNQVVR